MVALNDGVMLHFLALKARMIKGGWEYSERGWRVDPGWQMSTAADERCQG